LVGAGVEVVGLRVVVVCLDAEPVDGLVVAGLLLLGLRLVVVVDGLGLLVEFVVVCRSVRCVLRLAAAFGVELGLTAGEA